MLASPLNAAGFASATFTDIHEPVFYGPIVDAAHEASSACSWIRGSRLHALLEAHLTPEGVLFDSRA